MKTRDEATALWTVVAEDARRPWTSSLHNGYHVMPVFVDREAAAEYASLFGVTVRRCLVELVPDVVEGEYL